MIFLLLSILSSTLINLIFRWFRHFEINNSQAITVNYFSCVITGLIFHHEKVQHADWEPSAWWILSLSLGILFILVFHLIARTAQQIGVGIAAVSAKMSVLFPVVSGFLFFSETLGRVQIAGLLLSLVGVTLISRPDKSKHASTAQWWLPVLVFVGSGFIDTLLKWVQSMLGSNDASTSSILIFASAGCLGLLGNIRELIAKKASWKRKNIIAGILLGIPNYFSIYFLMKALSEPGISSVYIFPVNNVGVVLLASVLGMLLFAERYKGLRLLGMLLALISIVLMQWS